MPDIPPVKPTMIGKVVTSILVLGVLGVGFYLFTPHGHGGATPAVVAAPHGSETIVDGVLDTDQVDISSKLPGRLAQVYVREGDLVHTGQVVALLEAAELNAKQQQATAGVRGAQAQLHQGEIAVGLERHTTNDQVAQAQAGVAAANATLARAQAGVRAATAALGMAREKLAAMQSGARPQEIAEAEQGVVAAQATYDTAKKTNSRMQALADAGVVAQQKADEADMAYRSAQAQLTATQAKLSLVHAGARPEEIAAARDQVQQAQAGVDDAQQQVQLAQAGIDGARQQLQLAQDGRTMVAVRQQDVAAAQQKVAASQGQLNEVAAYQRQTRIVSPISGRVTQRMGLDGEIIAPGYAIMSVARTDGYWVDVYVDESQFAGHHVGDAVRVEIPALGKTVGGKISEMLSAADFASKRANNEKGSFDVRAVQLRVALDDKPRDLACGLTARVHLSGAGGQ